GSNFEKLKEIERIVKKSIRDSVFPGCQVLAVKNETVFYQEAFGYATYEKKKPVTNFSLYDIASVSKVIGTLSGVMTLVDEKKIDLRKKLGDYLPELIGSNKYDLRLIDVLTHQAGLKAWIPFYQKTLDKNNQWIAGIYDTA